MVLKVLLMRDGSRLLAGGRDARRPHSGGLSVSRATVTPRKDEPTVTPDGEPLEPRIEGLVVRWARGIEDKRGEIVEIYRPSWGLHPDPLAYVYQSSLHPGAIKGTTCLRRDGCTGASWSMRTGRGRRRGTFARASTRRGCRASTRPAGASTSTAG
jgi:hypothetical protein